MLIQPLALGCRHHDVVACSRCALKPERDLLFLSLVMVMSHPPRAPPGPDRPSAVLDTRYRDVSLNLRLAGLIGDHPHGVTGEALSRALKRAAQFRPGRESQRI
jgi:hypothetical protein